MTTGGERYAHRDSLISNKGARSGGSRLQHRACVATATKNARIVWAVLTRGQPYRTSAA